MTNNINYQQIYEAELSENIKRSLELPGRFFELSHQHRLMVEELIDIGYRRALEDALDPEVLGDTASLAGEMGAQLYHFANLVNSFLAQQNTPGED